MSSNNNDIALTIISNNEKAYYSTVKGIGSVFNDLKFGIYFEEKDIAFIKIDYPKDWTLKDTSVINNVKKIIGKFK